MDRPFNELHELYRIVYLRAEAQAKAEKERQEKEEKEKANGKGGPKYPQINRQPPTDVNNQPNQNQTISPLAAEAMEEAFEDLAEGGIF